MGFEPTIDDKDLAKLGRELERRNVTAPPEIGQGIWRSVNTFSGDFGRRRLSGQSGASLGRRSGELARSREVGVTGRSFIRTIRAFFRLTSKHALPHEAPPLGTAGQDITPKRSKFLAIPVGGARTGAGVSKFRSPRDDAPLTFIPSKREPGRKWYAVRKVEGREADLSEMRWVLVESVQLPARLNLRKDWIRALPRIARDIGRVARNVFRNLVR